ncbi:hypothetical protein ACJX0J_031240, partial [Zea mays]
RATVRLMSRLRPCGAASQSKLYGFEHKNISLILWHFRIDLDLDAVERSEGWRFTDRHDTALQLHDADQ